MKKELIIPKNNASDNSVRIINVFKKTSAKVKSTDIIFEYETSKAVFEVEAEMNGFIYHSMKINDNIPVGEVIAIITEEKLNYDQEKELNLKSNSEPLDSKNITKKALLLINKNSIDIDLINEDLITEKIVKKFIKDNQSTKKTKLKKYKFKKDDIVIMGIGGHAGICIDIIRSNSNYNLVGFIDKNIDVDRKYGLDFLGDINYLDYLIKCGLKNLVIGIGFMGKLKKRDDYYKNLSAKINIPTIIHSSAIIENSSKISNGCQIMAGAIIGSNVIIKENCIINAGSVISHDSVINRSSHITPGAVIAGQVNIGNRCTIGMCSTVFIGCKIQDDTTINNNERIIQ